MNCVIFAATSIEHLLFLIITMPGLNYKCFNKQLSIVRQMDENNEYKTQLDALDVKHKHVWLRGIYENDYIDEFNRSQLKDKLQIIFSYLSLSARQELIERYHKNEFVLIQSRTNENIKSCQSCGGSFSLVANSEELVCKICSRIEKIDSVAFHHADLYRDKNMVVKNGVKTDYQFKYRLYQLFGNNSLDSIRDGEKILLEIQRLTYDEINHTEHVHTSVKHYLPKNIPLNFKIYKILTLILKKGPRKQNILSYISLPDLNACVKYDRCWQEAIHCVNCH